jgi:glycerol-3-phosphate dehydrogenase (NAD(P)+)
VIQFPSRSKIAVLGAGTWGTTLSWLLSTNEKKVAVWSRDTAKLDNLRKLRKVERPLSIDIPETVEVHDDIKDCLDGADVIVFCCTAQSMRSVATLVAQALPARVAARPAAGSASGSPVLVSAAKGLELDTLKRMSEILTEVVPGHPVCALSGPNLAQEVLNRLPTASVVACQNEEVARFAQFRLSAPTFRLYTNTDVVGVELGGALKNIIGIAAGVSDGFKLGTNAKAALMTRGLAEMVRIATNMGARATTLSGLSGVGDLVATCYSPLSRNYRLGFKMAEGGDPDQVQKDLGAVAEGATTSFAVYELAQKLEVQVPIAEQVAAAVTRKTTPHKAIEALMSRPLASE